MPDDKTTQEPNAEGKDDGKTPPADFTAWLAGQPEDVQSLYEQHTAGLKSALKSERQRNADLAAELRDAAGKATGEAKAELDALATRAEEESRRGDFYEAAHSAGCTNLRLAYLAAREIDAFDKRGKPDIEAVKSKFPELFARPHVVDVRATQGSAGGGPAASASDAINRHIREAAGRTVV